MTAQAATSGQPLIGKRIVGRFAPSPTARSHLGHAYSAIDLRDVHLPIGFQFVTP